MSVSTPNLYPVFLNAEQRARLDEITRHGSAPARKVRHAQVLLLSDHNRPGGRKLRSQVSDILGMHVNTVDRIRRRFVQEGETPALNRKVRAAPPTPPKLDGRGEAHLVAICCGQPPEGRARWTLRLLADELKSRRIVTRISVETVRKALKKMSSSPGEKNAGAFPNATGPASSRKWRTFSTCTPRPTPKKNR